MSWFDRVDACIESNGGSLELSAGGRDRCVCGDGVIGSSCSVPIAALLESNGDELSRAMSSDSESWKEDMESEKGIEPSGWF